MADETFGGMTPKANLAWVPIALSTLASMELAWSGVVDPD